MSQTNALLQFIPQELVGFNRQPRSYILANGSARELAPRFNGNMFILPPVGVVGGYPARDRDGDIIPATRVVTDAFTFRHDTGEEVFVLNAEAAVRHVLGISRDGGGGVVCASTWAERGAFLIPQGSSKEEIAQYFEQARRRAEVAEVKDAFAFVAHVDTQNENRRAQAMPMITGGMEYQKAAALIARAHAEEMGVQPPSPIAAPQEVEEESPEDALELQLEVEAEILKMASRKAEETGVDKVQLFERLLGNPEVLKYVEKNFKVRKGRLRRRGHLDAAPQAAPQPPTSQPLVDTAALAAQFRAEAEHQIGREDTILDELADTPLTPIPEKE